MHTIRLRGAWTTATLPGGGTRHARNFGKPRTLDADECVWLVGDVAEAGTLSVNGEVAASVPAGRFAVDVTHKLAERNAVWIDLPTDHPPADVAMEIRRD